MRTGPVVAPTAQVAARAATHEPAMATRALGCQRPARLASARASARSPPNASKPVAPTHHRPGSPATGVTWGLAARSAAVTAVASAMIVSSYHWRTVSSAHTARASGTVMPGRTRARDAADDTARSRVPSTSAKSCSSHTGAHELLGELGRLGGAPGAGEDGARRRLAGVRHSAPAARALHAAAIGNLGMRTHATRHTDDILDLHGCSTSSFLDRDGNRVSSSLSRAREAEPERAGEPRARRG